MGGAVLLSYDLIMLKTMYNTLATLVSIAIGGSVYGIVLLLVGGISITDVERVPKVGGLAAKIIRLFRLARR